ncbi:MAG: hypothetical protein LC676_10795 [Loktanella sp.]|nr:hypothetical protein [Loktanella sp.]
MTMNRYDIQFYNRNTGEQIAARNIVAENGDTAVREARANDLRTVNCMILSITNWGTQFIT